MKKILEYLFNYNKLNYDQAKEILIDITSNKYSHSEIASFMTIYKMRNPSIEEMEGFRDALLEQCIKIDFDDFNTIDLCGTGGDGKDTFNISTISSFIVAGSGFKVTKHGNYGVSSNCGSSNVLEYLGVKFSNDENHLKKCLDQSNICYLHAPIFHPSMKNVAPIRKDLGFKTFFNLLGPLVNPSSPKNQITGVYNLEIARLYGYIFKNTNKNFSIVYSLDGYDEISLTGSFKLINNFSEFISDCNYFKLQKTTAKDILGGKSIEDSANIFKNILSGKGTNNQVNVVLANSSLAIQTITNKDIDECIEIAKESIESGKAYSSLKKLIEA
ncbi:MAG: anthranilate phosphoribosyltransferase [Cryomorphaceae bacterium]|nr:MAG: anthranilate phosphoribosyltransferase [Cryomorphaceae bacterium]